MRRVTVITLLSALIVTSCVYPSPVTVVVVVTATPTPIAPDTPTPIVLVVTATSTSGEGTVVETPIPVIATSTPELTETSHPTSTQPKPTDTPRPTPTPIPYAIVSSNSLNLRAGPGTNYFIIGVVRRNDWLQVRARTASGDWLMVDHPSQGGPAWVSTKYVSLNVPLDSILITTDIPVPPPPPYVAFSVNPTSIVAGQCVILRWDVENVEAVYLDGQGVVGHDSRQVCPSHTQTYTLRVVHGAGEIERQVTVSVAPAPKPSIVFTINPTSITAGQCATLRWDVDNVTAVYLDGGGVTGHDSRQVCPSQTQTYTLRVVYSGGEEYRQVTLAVSRPAVQLVVTATLSDDRLMFDQGFDQYIVVRNDGTEIAQGVRLYLRANPPGLFEVLNASHPMSPIAPAGVRLSLGDILPGDRVSVTIHARAPSRFAFPTTAGTNVEFVYSYDFYGHSETEGDRIRLAVSMTGGPVFFIIPKPH